jgi:hypothetical protein
MLLVISVTGMKETQAGAEIMTLKTSRPMKCAALVKEVPVEHAMTPTKVSVILPVTNVNGTMLIQAHVVIMIQMNSNLEICAASAVVEPAQVEIGKSLALVDTRPSA